MTLHLIILTRDLINLILDDLSSLDIISFIQINKHYHQFWTPERKDKSLLIQLQYKTGIFHPENKMALDNLIIRHLRFNLSAKLTDPAQIRWDIDSLEQWNSILTPQDEFLFISFEFSTLKYYTKGMF